MKIYFRKCGWMVATEFSCLFKAFAKRTSLKSVALKASTVLPTLLLQRLLKETSDKMNHTVFD